MDDKVGCSGCDKAEIYGATVEKEECNVSAEYYGWIFVWMVNDHAFYDRRKNKRTRQKRRTRTAVEDCRDDS